MRIVSVTRCNGEGMLLSCWTANCSVGLALGFASALMGNTCLVKTGRYGCAVAAGRKELDNLQLDNTELSNESLSRGSPVRRSGGSSVGGPK